jgi:(S)-ureidoglycine aminohydrolase
MQQLGFTRTRVKRDHALLTPDSFIRAPFPGDQNCTRVVHINPAMGAGFLMYTLEASKDAFLATMLENHSSFIFVLEGEFVLQIDAQSHALQLGQHAFIPPNTAFTLETEQAARAVVFEKPYFELSGFEAPKFFVANAQDITSSPVLNDPRVRVQVLLPDEPKFDFAVNIMNFEPGAHLSLIETHVMEHGLLMLSGGGIYRLSDDWYPVQSGDVIYMAPYCPQWFGALGATSSRYLIYKDWNRR